MSSDLTDKSIEEELMPYAAHILRDRTFLSQKAYVQHGRFSVYSHELHVAHFALSVNRALGLHCDMETLVRGALLHDYFLYDWHTGGEGGCPSQAPRLFPSGYGTQKCRPGLPFKRPGTGRHQKTHVASDRDSAGLSGSLGRDHRGQNGYHVGKDRRCVTRIQKRISLRETGGFLLFMRKRHDFQSLFRLFH